MTCNQVARRVSRRWGHWGEDASAKVISGRPLTVGGREPGTVGNETWGLLNRAAKPLLKLRHIRECLLHSKVGIQLPPG